MDLRAVLHRPLCSSETLSFPKHTAHRELFRNPKFSVRDLRLAQSSRPLRAHAVSSSRAGASGDETVVIKRPIRTLLIDNYDSYTYNLYQLLSVINGAPPKVIKNDEMQWEELYKLLYGEHAFDNIVISPGPGSPICAKDVGLCLQVLQECVDIPILGVCLGHQALGYVNGAKVIHAPEPVHGRLSEIQHIGCPLFLNVPSGIGSGFKVVRYHSLVLDPDSLPDDLVPTAWTIDSCRSMSSTSGQKINEITFSGLENQTGWALSVPDTMTGFFPNKEGNISQYNTSSIPLHRKATDVIMAVSHRSRPHYGVQFHPESVATSFGKQILENFHDLTVQFQQDKKCRRNPKGVCPLEDSISSQVASQNSSGSKSTVKSNDCSLKLYWEKIDGISSEAGGSEGIFCGLFGDGFAKDTFWLDSSLQHGQARFSFMGGKGGNLWKRLTYSMSTKHVSSGGTLKIETTNFVEEVQLEEGFLCFLGNELQSFGTLQQESGGLPFDFWGGFVGYLGYELKAECGAAYNQHKSHHPDACFFFVDRFIAVDHLTDDVYVVALYKEKGVPSQTGPSPASKFSSVNGTQNAGTSEHLSAQIWAKKTINQLHDLVQGGIDLSLERRYSSHLASSSVSHVNSASHFTMSKSKAQYMDDVKSCLSYIRDGESYELCLTTQLHKKVNTVDPLGLYLTLRKTNPAPYAAWLNFGSEELCICCSSPERFLRLDQSGILEAKPIKGTIPRGRSPSEDEKLKLKLQDSEKDQAENLMIVDLLRNDLGRVCTPGSVYVPSLMAVESYATVHTMVSTVRGTKKPDVTLMDCVRASFPGGSMTGAPKLRSMEILDKLESGPRGIYSGSIGFLSINSSFDLNIVIRTLVIHKGIASLGAGGAVVSLSNPSDEYEEMLLKTKAPVRAVSQLEALANFLDKEFESESSSPTPLLASH